MAGINKVILIGNLGKDPEIRAIEGGRKVARFTLATTETYKDKEGQRHEQTEWHNVEFWGPVAEVIERYLRKGSQVYVEGRLRTRSYQDKENQTRYITEIVGQNMTMLGGNGGGGSRPADMGVGGTQQTATPSSAPSYNTSGNEVQEDDLPF